MYRRYSLRTGAVVHRIGTADAEVEIGGRPRPLRCSGPLAEVVGRLGEGRCTLSRLTTASGYTMTTVVAALEQLDRFGIVEHGVDVDGRRIMTLEPMTSRPAVWGPPPTATAAPESLVLSRFAVIRREADGLVAESPLSNFRAHLHGTESALLLLELTGAAQHVSLGHAAHTGLDGSAVRDCASLLAHGGFVISTDDESAVLPDEDTAVRLGWAPHDLLFHTRSRPGAHDHPVGRTYPLKGQQAPLPALPPPRGSRIPLPAADISALMDDDRPFTAVLENRRSRRHHGRIAISRRELGEFLFRSARVIESIPAEPAEGVRYEATRRPYPGGGAAYELEIYPVVRACEDLTPGVYHYAAGSHALESLAPSEERAHNILAEAARATSADDLPQVLLVITARLTRLTWKYSGMAYATALKDVGALYQTMYLVAEAMDLACCAVGTANSPKLSTLIGVSDLEEPPVGELVIGSAS